MTKDELNHLLCDCEYFLNCNGEKSLYNFVENLRTTYLEPREKRIKELESQNNWLEGCKLELAELLGKANDKIAELEKENAELKKKCYKKAVKDYCKLEKENTELREVLKEVVEYLGQYCNDYPDCIIKAEPFIKESEKE